MRISGRFSQIRNVFVISACAAVLALTACGKSDEPPAEAPKTALSPQQVDAIRAYIVSRAIHARKPSRPEGTH